MNPNSTYMPATTHSKKSALHGFIFIAYLATYSIADYTEPHGTMNHEEQTENNVERSSCALIRDCPGIFLKGPLPPNPHPKKPWSVWLISVNSSYPVSKYIKFSCKCQKISKKTYHFYNVTLKTKL
jgi:hypothetical protein